MCVARAGVHRLTRIRGVDPFVVVFRVHRVRQSLVCFASSFILLLTSSHTAPALYFPWLTMAPTRCSACRRFVRKDDSVVCTEGCGAVYHTACATEGLGYVPSDTPDCVCFHCDSCTIHRSPVTSRTPKGVHDCPASQGSSSSTTITLDDVMQQLKQSSGAEDVRFGHIQESLSGMERTMGAIRADVADLSASHQLLSERVSALEARAELAHSDPHAMREDSLALNSRLSELTSRLSSAVKLAARQPAASRRLHRRRHSLEPPCGRDRMTGILRSRAGRNAGVYK